MKLIAFLTFFSYTSATCVPVAPANQNLTLHLGAAEFNNGSSIRVDMGANSILTVTIDTQGMGNAFGLTVLPCAGTTDVKSVWSTQEYISRQDGDNSNGGYTHCFIGVKNFSYVKLVDLPYYCWRSFATNKNYNALDDNATGTSAFFEAVVKTTADQAAVIYLVPSLGKTSTSKRWLNPSSTICASNIWSWSDPFDDTQTRVAGSVYEAWAIPTNESCPLKPNPEYRCGLELFGMKVPSVNPSTASGAICKAPRNCTTGETGLPVGSYDVGIIATAPTGASESIFSCNTNVMVGDKPPTNAPTNAPTKATTNTTTNTTGQIAGGSTLEPVLLLAGVLAFWI